MLLQDETILDALPSLGLTCIISPCIGIPYGEHETSKFLHYVPTFYVDKSSTFNYIVDKVVTFCRDDPALRNWGWVNIWCHLTTIGNPIMEIRWSYEQLISAIGFPKLVRWHLYIVSEPSSFAVFFLVRMARGLFYLQRFSLTSIRIRTWISHHIHINRGT